MRVARSPARRRCCPSATTKDEVKGSIAAQASRARGLTLSSAWRNAYINSPPQPYWLAALALLPGLGLRQFALELLDAALHRRNPAVQQSDIEEGDVVGRRIQRVAVAEPRRVVHLYVLEAELLQHTRGLRGARAAL